MAESFSSFEQSSRPERRSADLLKEFYLDASDEALKYLNHGIIAPHVSREVRLQSIALFNELKERQLKEERKLEAVTGNEPITLPNEMRITVERKANGQLVLHPSNVATEFSTVDAAGPEEFHEPADELRDAA